MIPSPNFLIIGTQKSGTKSHAFHLNQHPDIYVHNKELHFFDVNVDQLNYDQFHSNFKGITNKVAIGVSTPSYMFLRYAIDNIYKYNSEMKLIIVLREPVSRAYSQYEMDASNGLITKSFLDSIRSIEHINLPDIESTGYWALQRGFYIDQIEYILSVFEEKNVLILISEQILNTPLHEYNKVFQFLGLSDLDQDSFDFKGRVHKQIYKNNISRSEFDYVSRIYKPYNDRLYKFLGYQISEWRQG